MAEVLFDDGLDDDDVFRFHLSLCSSSCVYDVATHRSRISCRDVSLMSRLRGKESLEISVLGGVNDVMNSDTTSRIHHLITN